MNSIDILNIKVNYDFIQNNIIIILEIFIIFNIFSV